MLNGGTVNVVKHACLCRSGTEEDYGELTQLLEDIFTYRRDVLPVLNKEKQERQKQEKQKQEDKKQAEAMRKSAMETFSRKLVNPSVELGSM